MKVLNLSSNSFAEIDDADVDADADADADVSDVRRRAGHCFAQFKMTAQRSMSWRSTVRYPTLKMILPSSGTK